MPETFTSLLAFNRGKLSRFGLARLDLKDHVFLAAEKQTNWTSSVLGSMRLRAGLKYLGTTASNNKAFYVPFVFSATDTADLEFTDSLMRVWISDTVLTRPSVSSAVTNGSFGSDVSGWTDNDASGGVSSWLTGGYLSLLGSGFAAARRTQQVTVSGGDANVEHALRIVIARGPVNLKVGSTSGGDDYIASTNLKTGTHSLAFTPTGNFYIDFSSTRSHSVLVDSVAVESSGAVTIATPWPLAALPYIRYDQSADVVFLTGGGSYTPYRAERRGTGRSWSLVKYEPEDGPFLVPNTTPITITSSALSGDVTLTSSADLFRTTHVGALFRVSSTGQSVTGSLTAADQFTSTVRVTGVGATRAFSFTITGTWIATVTIQRSLDGSSGWGDVLTYTSNTADTYTDGLDNQIYYYRIGIKAGNFTSGTAVVTLTYSSGSLAGIARITARSSATSASAVIITPFGSTTASSSWEEGSWSDYRGWPSAVRFFQGRLWWAGKQYIFGSVSDAYESFDDTTTGDSGPIQRSIGSGPLDDVNWLLPLSRLFVGTDGAEWQAKSSSLDEPLSPTAFSLVSQGTQGSASVDAVKMDGSGFFVQAGGVRVYAIAYKYTGLTDDYGSEDTTRFVPEIGRPGITRIAIQRQPDTRLHCVRSDGTVALLIVEKNENVLCWVEIETDGIIEDVEIRTSGTEEDAVYYCVKRTINGSTVRYREKFSLESESYYGTYVYDGVSATVLSLVDDAGDPIYPDGTVVTARTSAGVKIGNYTVASSAITLGSPVTYAEITPSIYKLCDAFAEYSGSATDTIGGASHLEGEQVAVWADGKDFSPGTGTDQTLYTVTSGVITLPTGSQVQKAVYGLPYTARYKSGKLGYINDSIALSQEKKIASLALILADTHNLGVHYGSDFSVLDDLPQVGPDGETVSSNHVWRSLDDVSFSLDGTWSPDSRLCLEANSPRPACVMAAVLKMEVQPR